MPNYDREHFDPPAPVALVAVRNPIGGATVSGVELLIDSGADVTLLPRSCVLQIGIQVDTTAH